MTSSIDGKFVAVATPVLRCVRLVQGHAQVYSSDSNERTMDMDQKLNSLFNLKREIDSFCNVRNAIFRSDN